MITLQYKIEMDLCEDYSEMVQSWMKEHGVQSDKSGEDLWYDFFNLQKKSVRPQKRAVHYSKVFACPPEVELGLKLLVQKFDNGEDVSQHLSKDAASPSEFDGLLYDWGIYHFPQPEKRLIIKQDVLSALAQFYLQKLTMKMSIASMYIVTGKMFNNLGPNRIC